MSNKLFQNGWEEFDVDPSNDLSLIELAKEFGTPTPDHSGSLVQILKCKSTQSAINGSFSYNYGKDAFPLHTDTAFDSIPARFFLLVSLTASNTSTTVINLRNIIINDCTPHELKILEKSIFLMSTPLEKKFVSLFFLENAIKGIRYDPNIMSPYNRAAYHSVEIIVKHVNRNKISKILWSGVNAVVIDNWNCLHGRDEVVEKNRTLKRIYIK